MYVLASLSVCLSDFLRLYGCVFVCLANQNPKRWTENDHRWYEDHTLSEVERTAGLLLLEESRGGKLLCQSEKMKRLPSHPTASLA